MITVLIIKHPNEYIHSDVLRAVSLGYRLNVINSMTEKNEPNKLRRIVAARNQYREVHQLRENPFTLLLDSDTVIPKGSDAQTIEYLERFNYYKAVGIPHGYVMSDYHVSLAAMMVRTEILFDIEFRIGESCECQAFCDDIRKQGFGVTYLKTAGYCEEKLKN